ncbi:PREDICTED: PHD finger protein 14 isoform X1 [Papilio xuthus]|uniref:PHD finger protein 14 isoform X1 n=1 Tax=Papilio xuthus TaxID=66420 RepID=A0AAJ6Z446_PAPXU|nr:PREDICTED: PHD finger protein 14 isoform X1 [Papilio xuthus]XP_013165052.1 PREDICTED: PHD finger protein 14 isoform X1 [Papilio xuthus]XP_013165053.1 PREDICTED: PHD finger protein 14 isoform X1 [Papilio xuthus]XP_013165054.1 PREDICTED: PHD finger protein 14 isoform X1 [Papilio xuthus]XP_013165055.1 PREDICTED: PHD finger protein 14 isoform X1 [Papilio xuthus]
MSNPGRGLAKRKVKPVEPQSLLDFDLGEGESSDDSDFRIEDHPEESDDYSINTDDEEKKENANSGSSDDQSGSDIENDFKNSTNKLGQVICVTDLLEKANNREFKFPGELANMLICAGCLGSRSDDFNEIVECDGCGVTVHEGCYGVSDVTSESSTVSSASTEPWFCEACKAGVTDPNCELCPNKGGIFKETEVGAWVHLVCALYVPGVAFSEVERLSGVTLFEMAYSRWGARSCALCEDATLARTGVCVGCDAGMCKTFFHVTCGQREGLLAEAHSEEVEQADPFYAHCRLHSDKTLVKKRKRNWLALQLRTEKRKMELKMNLSTDEKLRIQRKLVKYRRKYAQQKENRNPPWVPTQKMARMLYSSASAMRKFQKKAECMGIDTHALEFQDAQMAALKDVSRRWHVPPAFSVEFVGYYLERNNRVTSLRKSLERLTKENEKLLSEDDKLRADYDEAAQENTDALNELTSTRQALQKIYDAIIMISPKKTVPSVMEDKPLLPPQLPRSTPKVTPQQLQKRSMSVPTAAALKMGVGFPLSDNPDARQGKVLSTSLEATSGGLAARECAACGRSSERHLMAACDTCRHHYHLHCLKPPLQRPPKKSKLYGWQCSECDKTSDSEPEVMEKKVPRRSRIRYSKDGTIITEPLSPGIVPNSPPTKKAHKTEKSKTNGLGIPENISPIKVTIKPFEFSSDGHENTEVKSKKDKKAKSSKQREYATSGGEEHPMKKLHKRSFTSPTLTNTPLMSITPIVADSPNDSHNENSNASLTTASGKKEDGYLPQNLSFSSLLGDAKERDSKTIESSIENTLANLSSDIATYKANRKRRKEKHRSRYSPDLLRSPSKPHKHKRKKKTQDLENPEMPHPRITIKIKPIPKPDGSLDTQMFYVPTDSNDGPPPAVMKKLSKQATQITVPESEAPNDSPSEPQESTDTSLTPVRGREARGRRSGGAESGGAAGALAPLTHCDVCTQPGDPTNLVRCDECQRRYHFTCLEPPLNKNPKKRGYSWHCADCDPTDVEENN